MKDGEFDQVGTASELITDARHRLRERVHRRHSQSEGVDRRRRHAIDTDDAWPPNGIGRCDRGVPPSAAARGQRSDHRGGQERHAGAASSIVKWSLTSWSGAVTATAPTVPTGIAARDLRKWLPLAALVGGGIILQVLFAGDDVFPARWDATFESPIDDAGNWLRSNRSSHPVFTAFFTPLSSAIDAIITGISDLLLWLPWFVVIGLAAAIPARVRNYKASATVAVALVYTGRDRTVGGNDADVGLDVCRGSSCGVHRAPSRNPGCTEAWIRNRPTSPARHHADGARVRVLPSPLHAFRHRQRPRRSRHADLRAATGGATHHLGNPFGAVPCGRSVADVRSHAPRP